MSLSPPNAGTRRQREMVSLHPAAGKTQLRRIVQWRKWTPPRRYAAGAYALFLCRRGAIRPAGSVRRRAVLQTLLSGAALLKNLVIFLLSAALCCYIDASSRPPVAPSAAVQA
ncbi:hypothetical protein [Tahibacter harae]|uniref:Uncharacterized protein n=1 Tax=Tahibacter harae TaxID=2963937 RepID=A0ABT1QNP5_9GAMM|nr:hypothetical protein [Tahibacter harae]MCQ4163140.1 hypothetical protein [Tahibacter harae]